MPSASRVAGQGRLLQTLRRLIARIDKFAAYRATTSHERRWSNILADRLQEAYTVALTPEARRSLDAVDRRVAVSQKLPNTTRSDRGAWP
jgi:hypothetical protein